MLNAQIYFPRKNKSKSRRLVVTHWTPTSSPCSTLGWAVKSLREARQPSDTGKIWMIRAISLPRTQTAQVQNARLHLELVDKLLTKLLAQWSTTTSLTIGRYQDQVTTSLTQKRPSMSTLSTRCVQRLIKNVSPRWWWNPDTIFVNMLFFPHCHSV